MIVLWLFTLRVAVTASYLTLTFTNVPVANDLRWPFAFAAFAVAVWDLHAMRRA